MNSNANSGKGMFIFGALSLLFSMAFASASWYTIVSFGHLGESAFQSLRAIGLLLSVASLAFFFKGLTKTFSRGKRAKSGIAIMIVGAVILVAGLWIAMGSLFNLWGINNPRGFVAMISVALVLFILSLGLGYWGYCRATFIEKRKIMGRIITAH